MSFGEVGRARAEHARQNVENYRCADARVRDGFCGIADSLPPSIRINGLGMALAHAMATNGGNRAKLKRNSAEFGAWAALDTLAEWLLSLSTRASHAVPAPPAEATGTTAEELLQAVVQGDQRYYQAAMAEALEILQWLKMLSRSIDPKRAPWPDDQGASDVEGDPAEEPGEEGRDA